MAVACDLSLSLSLSHFYSLVLYVFWVPFVHCLHCICNSNSITITVQYQNSYTKILTYYYPDVKKMTRWSKWVNMMAKAEMQKKKENHAQNETMPTKMKRKLMENNKKNCNRRWRRGGVCDPFQGSYRSFYLILFFLPILFRLHSTVRLSCPVLTFLNLCEARNSCRLAPLFLCLHMYTFNILLNSIRIVFGTNMVKNVEIVILLSATAI